MRRLVSCIALAALMVPLTASAVPACRTTGDCPMDAGGRMPGCHGKAVQAADCCAAEAPAAVAIEGLAPQAAVVAAAWLGDPANAVGRPRTEEASSGPLASPTPLYTLFRSLLI